jgi:hypothetical protein
MLIHGTLIVGRLTKDPPPNRPQPPHSKFLLVFFKKPTQPTHRSQKSCPCSFDTKEVRKKISSQPTQPPQLKISVEKSERIKE